MKVVREMSLWDFEAWSGAKLTREIIIANDKVEEFDQLIEELYPEGINETELNDILWFDNEQIFEALGITDEEEDE